MMIPFSLLLFRRHLSGIVAFSQFLRLSDYLRKNVNITKWFACETNEELLIIFQHQVAQESF